MQNVISRSGTKPAYLSAAFIIFCISGCGIQKIIAIKCQIYKNVRELPAAGRLFGIIEKKAIPNIGQRTKQPAAHWIGAEKAGKTSVRGI